MKSLIKSSVLVGVFVFAGLVLPTSAFADPEFYFQQDPNAGYMDGYIPEAPPIEMTITPTITGETIYQPQVISGETIYQPQQEVAPQISGETIYPALAQETPVGTLAPEYPIYGNYGGYNMYGSSGI